MSHVICPEHQDNLQNSFLAHDNYCFNSLKRSGPPTTHSECNPNNPGLRAHRLSVQNIKKVNFYLFHCFYLTLRIYFWHLTPIFNLFLPRGPPTTHSGDHQHIQKHIHNIVSESFKCSGPPTTHSDGQKYIQKHIHNITYIYCYFLSQTSHLISPEHQEHLQNYFEPPENSLRIIQTPWTTNNTFARPKTHSKTHSQYIAAFLLKLRI